jgi:hypothetical protein
MASRWIHNEVAFMLRLVATTAPSLRASSDVQSDFFLFKALAYEMLAATEPALAANALQIADRAMSEAHALRLHY